MKLSNMTNQNLSLAPGFTQIEVFTVPVCLIIILHSMEDQALISLYTSMSI